MAADADYQQISRVVTYALEDLGGLSDEWFVHDKHERTHVITRGQEEFDFTKSHFSKYDPTCIGFDLQVPQTAGLTFFTLWIQHPRSDTGANRRATEAALLRLKNTRNVKQIQVDARLYTEAPVST
ncbi:hypothetical protein C8Q80DRAFT_1348024 [Daedaleopsis nitida]|nr:hypothetical protein C8Q80DRAFT_1348024 [Daedaleopsis nitida]